MPTLVIAGAGLTGLSAASQAGRRGWTPLLVERGSGPGGRLASQDLGEPASPFDAGAQFFSVRDPAFAEAAAGWASAGLITAWSRGFPVLDAAGQRDGDDGHVRWRAAGGMAGLAAGLAQGLDLRVRCTVTGLRAEAGGWRVALRHDGEDSVVAADAVLLTQPVPEILALLAASGIALAPGTQGRLEAVRYDPCLCLLIDLPGGGPVLPEPGGLRIDDPASPLSWIASQRRKGLRPSGDGLVLHFRGPWSATCLDLDEAALLERAVAAALPILARLGIALSGAACALRRWRHSLATTTLVEPCLRLDVGAPLLLAGDAFGDRPRMEGAWLSGRAAADALQDVEERPMGSRSG